MRKRSKIDELIQVQKKPRKLDMTSIIDYESLEARRLETASKKKEKPKEIVSANKPLRWFEKQMSEDDFSIVENKGVFLVRHKDWKPTVFIGTFNSKEAALSFLKDYIKEANKPFLKRKLVKGLHSIVVNIKD